MASAPEQQNQLPMLYNELVPLNKSDHGNWRSRKTNKAKWLTNQHAVPLTVEEFPQAQRNFPIVFSAGQTPVPLALMGMNEGVNVYVEDDGTVNGRIYMPAYARRYPFMLAKLSPNAEDLSLCVDPTSDLVGEFDEGDALFEGDGPSESVQNTLKFCEQFEIAGQKTANFVQELTKHDLLMDGELTVRPEGREQPVTYRGFRIVNTEKLKDLRGDVLRGWAQSGMLALIYAHIFSLDMVREIFGRQMEQGKLPEPSAAPAQPEQS